MTFGAANQQVRGNNPQYQVRLFWNTNNFANESSSSQNFYVTTQNVPQNTTLYWEFVGVVGPTGYTSPASSADFLVSSGSFTHDWAYSDAGNIILQSLLIDGNTTQVSFQVLMDNLTEGGEAFQIRIRTDSLSGPIVGTSDILKIVDLSTTPAPTYSVSPAANNVNEGSSLVFNVTTTNVTNGTTLYWSLNNTTDFATSSGSFTINSNAGSFSVTPIADTTTEGPETFIAYVRTGNTAGTIVATSSSVTINDTSTTPASYTDANAQYLRLALPFNSTKGLDDISHQFINAVNTSATSRSGPTNNAVSITTAQSKYYGSSAVGQRTGVALTFTLPANIVIGSNFCIEFWAKTTFTTNTNNWVWGDGYSSRELAVGIYNSGTLPTNLTISAGSGRIGGVGTGWNHFAFNNGNWYFNGVRRGTPNYGAAGWSFNSLRVFQQESGDPNNFIGWMNDFRVYIGTNKYSANFTPPGQMIP